MNLLKVSGISKQGGDKLTLKNINFTQERLQKIALAGETGSGKSTLLKTIAGLVQPDAGEALFENRRIEGPEEKLVAGHDNIKYLSQHFELPRFLRVEETFPYQSMLPSDETQEIYEVCRIDHLLKRKTEQVSGGERQRIALARLLTTWPDLLLLDEPFSNLDMAHKNTLKAVIEDISERLEITCIMASHDPTDTLSWADEVLVMREGEIIQRGSPENIYKQPVNAYVAGLFGKYNLVEAAQLKGFSEVIVSVENKDDRRKVLVRPEQFKIVREGVQGRKGKVMSTKFYGSYYEIEVAISGKVIVVKSETDSFKNGTTVDVSLIESSFWSIPD